MHEPMPPFEAPPLPVPVDFSGARPVFRRMVLRGGFLELLTLGFYRFWLTTDMRRHLWSHTSVNGDPAEYTGRARELLIGFLIAMAVLVPIYVAFFFLTMEAERLYAFASLPLGLLLYALVQFAIYRARKYRVTRTVWRGLRFSMGGSGWNYALRAFGWAILITLTLGIAWPWRTASLERYKMRHTAYGSLQGDFTGTGFSLAKRVWFVWLTPVVFAIVGYALPYLAVILVLFLPFVWAIFRALEWQWWVSNLRFGEVYFDSSLDKSDFITTYWKVIGWALLISLILGVIIGGATYAILAALTDFSSEAAVADALQHPALFGVSILGYLAGALAMGAVIRIYLMRDIWAAVAATTEVYNLSAADDVAGQGVTSNAFGEGLADGLDFGGGF
jgi:uncharacterized membrane protein YjgN (DUF898 family)